MPSRGPAERDPGLNKNPSIELLETLLERSLGLSRLAVVSVLLVLFCPTLLSSGITRRVLGFDQGLYHEY